LVGAGVFVAVYKEPEDVEEEEEGNDAPSTQAQNSISDELSAALLADGDQDGRPSFRKSGRPGRGRMISTKFSQCSRSKSALKSASSLSRLRSMQTSNREQVKIAPMYLKVGGSTSSVNNPLYMSYRSFGMGAGSGDWESL
jgi:hypothetical protein